jgi:hypothetical protein
MSIALSFQRLIDCACGLGRRTLPEHRPGHHLPAAGRRRAGRSRSGDVGAEAASAGAPFRLVGVGAGAGGRAITCPPWPAGRVRPRRAGTAHRRVVRRRPAADMLGCRARAGIYKCALGSCVAGSPRFYWRTQLVCTDGTRRGERLGSNERARSDRVRVA